MTVYSLRYPGFRTEEGVECLCAGHLPYKEFQEVPTREWTSHWALQWHGAALEGRMDSALFICHYFETGKLNKQICLMVGKERSCQKTQELSLATKLRIGTKMINFESLIIGNPQP